MQGEIRNAVLLAMSALLLGIAGCQHAKQATLPAKIPSPPDIQISGHNQEWPPRPQGRTNVVDVPYTEFAGALTAAREAQLRQAATQDARVRAALGERFGYIAANRAEPDKERPNISAEAIPFRLTFYSYSNNVAVEVLMKKDTVAEVSRREGYQPPEGAEEIKEAIALAQRESRLSEAVKGMYATAILTAPAKGTPGYGHRVLHVSFTATGGPEEVPTYYALVDLTEQKVVVAERVGRRDQ
jgi:hypothetical protein